MEEGWGMPKRMWLWTACLREMVKWQIPRSVASRNKSPEVGICLGEELRKGRVWSHLVWMQNLYALLPSYRLQWWWPLLLFLLSLLLAWHQTSLQLLEFWWFLKMSDTLSLSSPRNYGIVICSRCRNSPWPSYQELVMPGSKTRR